MIYSVDPAIIRGTSECPTFCRYYCAAKPVVCPPFVFQGGIHAQL